MMKTLMTIPLRLAMLCAVLLCALNASSQNLQYFIKTQSQQDFEAVSELMESRGYNADLAAVFILKDPRLQATQLLTINDPDVKQCIAWLKTLEQVDYIEPVPKQQTFYTPNDLHANQWSLNTISAELVRGVQILKLVLDQVVLISFHLLLHWPHEPLEPA